MKREDIEKAAGDYSGSSLGFTDNNSVMVKHKAFADGAEWRINSVWHNDTEKPDPDKGDLLVGIEVMGKTAYIRQNAYYVLQFGCVRWAYVEDLKPNTEE